MTDLELEFRISKLELRPGDMIVFKCRDRLSQRSADHLRAEAKKIFGEDRKCLVLEGGLDIAVLRENGELNAA